ncbi:YciI family protein [Rummeliibacillus pycnus]|uniref:YciI family protein n=1 Tax=Rummeliibacillus pycnus TaxID=101070 RepID=UPI003D29D1C0
MRAIIFYKIASGKTREELMKVYPRHRMHVDKFLAQNKIISMGALTEQTIDGVGSFGIFVDKATAEDFVAGDPFFLEGLVGHYEISEFNDVVSE